MKYRMSLICQFCGNPFGAHRASTGQCPTGKADTRFSHQAFEPKGRTKKPLKDWPI